MAKTASPSPSYSPTDSSATAGEIIPLSAFHGIVLDRGFTVRSLCSKLHVAAESLRAAYHDPGRLSLNAAMAFSELVGEDPDKVVVGMMAEIKERRQKGSAPAAPVRSRTLKTKTPANSEGH